MLRLKVADVVHTVYYLKEKGMTKKKKKAARSLRKQANAQAVELNAIYK